MTNVGKLDCYVTKSDFNENPVNIKLSYNKYFALNLKCEVY